MCYFCHSLWFVDIWAKNDGGERLSQTNIWGVLQGGRLDALKPEQQGGGRWRAWGQAVRREAAGAQASREPSKSSELHCKERANSWKVWPEERRCLTCVLKGLLWLLYGGQTLGSADESRSAGKWLLPQGVRVRTETVPLPQMLGDDAQMLWSKQWLWIWSSGQGLEVYNGLSLAYRLYLKDGAYWHNLEERVQGRKRSESRAQGYPNIYRLQRRLRIRGLLRRKTKGVLSWGLGEERNQVCEKIKCPEKAT